MKKKIKDRNKNIENTIKGILLSNRTLTTKNLKFNMFREILLSDKLDEIILKYTHDFRNLVVAYKDKINECPELENANYYFQKAEKVRISRINTIINSNKTQEVTKEKLLSKHKDKEIEENWVNRNYMMIKFPDSYIEAKIDDITQFNYVLDLLKVDSINNIISEEFSMDKNDLYNWIKSIKGYSLDKYNINPQITKNIISIDNIEKFFIYYILTDGKIHIIHRKNIAALGGLV